MPDFPATLDPRTTALVVMDYQPAILDALGDPDRLVARAREAIDLVRSRGGHVAYVRIAFEPSDLEAVPAHSAFAPAAAAVAEPLRHGAPTAEVHDRLTPEPGDIVVRKTRVGAFSTTDLDERLQAAGIHTLVLAGVSTSGVVLSTVRDAHDRDYAVLVLADASGDPREDIHAFLTEHIFPRQARVIELEELGRLLVAEEANR